MNRKFNILLSPLRKISLNYKKNRRWLIGLLLVVLLLVAYLVSPAGPFKPDRQVFGEKEILARVGKFEEVKDYKNLPAQVKYLDQKALNDAAKRFPVIYQGVQRDIYEVRYSTGTGGILLLYDAKSDKVLKTFNLLDWKQ